MKTSSKVTGKEVKGTTTSKSTKKSTISDKLTKAEDKTKKVIEKEVKKEAPINKATTTTRKVGDIHPTKPWVWKEIKPGKFDWRTIPSDNPKPKAEKKETTKPQAKNKPVPAKEPAKLTPFLKNKVKTEVTEKLKSNKSFQHALWAKQTDNRLYVEFSKTSKIALEKMTTIQAELTEKYKDLNIVFEVRKSLN